MDRKYILVVDEGTTGVRALVFGKDMNVVAQSYLGITSHYPEPYAVEQDPNEIYECTVTVMREAVDKAGIAPEEIAAMGIAAQRGSWTYWDGETGEPMRNTITWCDTRARNLRGKYENNRALLSRFPSLHKSMMYSDIDVRLAYEYLSAREPVFSKRSKLPGTMLGPVDAWLVYNLTGGRCNVCSRGQASTTTPYDDSVGDWDFESLEHFGLDRSVMPQIMMDCADYGMVQKSILGAEFPICADMADQASAMLGEGCVAPNSAKCTLGTGCYIDVNTGSNFIRKSGYQSAVGWETAEGRQYFLEGCVPGTGRTLEWIKDNVGLISDFMELQAHIAQTKDNGGVYFIPALVPMTSEPLKDPAMCAAFMGITAGTQKAHLIRASLESTAYAMAYAIQDLEKSAGKFCEIKIDGGASRSDFICQMIANLTDAKIIRAAEVEATAKGAAYMAAVGLGWGSLADMANYFVEEKSFLPNGDSRRDNAQFEWWKKALDRAGHWYEA